MTESSVPTNNMGSGEHISTYDPLIKAKKKKLREIITKKARGNGG